MRDLKDGETAEIQGSAANPYIIKNVGGVYSCSCIAWKMQSQAINKRTCKHIRKLRGDKAESERLGGSLVMRAGKTKKKVTNVPPALSLAHKWTPDIDPTGWHISEKLDGIRAYWNGKELISRLGNTFYAPKWLIDLLPKGIHLDGELWMGRGQFQKAVSIVKRQDIPKEWDLIRYVVFDAVPDGTFIGETTPFEVRYSLAKEAVNNINDKHVELLEQKYCKGVEDVKKSLKEVEAKGGEGVMLRKANSTYARGRSQTLLKVKSFHDDEATVTGYQAGTGKHKGRMGAVLVKLSNGKEFKVGTGFSDKERENPPKIGSLITFRYTELTKDGIPRFPAYVGPAIDK